MKFHTYVDRADDGRPFYVGMGNDDRIKGFERNAKHSNVAAKHGIKREIIASFDQRQNAVELEIKLIAELHTFVDDPLRSDIACNFTVGGDGLSSPSKESRKLLSEKAKAAHARIDVKERHRLACAAAYNDPDVKARRKILTSDLEYKKRRAESISRAKRGVPQSEEARKINIESHKGHRVREDVKIAIGRASRAENRKCSLCEKMGHYRHHCPERDSA